MKSSLLLSVRLEKGTEICMLTPFPSTSKSNMEIFKFLFSVVPGKGGVTALRCLLDRGYRNIHLLAFICDYCNYLFHTKSYIEFDTCHKLQNSNYMQCRRTEEENIPVMLSYLLLPQSGLRVALGQSEIPHQWNVSIK